jgi:hypothetical protein
MSQAKATLASTSITSVATCLGVWVSTLTFDSVHYKNSSMLKSVARNVGNFVFITVVSVLGALGVTYALISTNAAAGLVGGCLLLGVVCFINVRALPLGARVVYRNRITLPVPGVKSIEIQPPFGYRRARLVVLFGRSRGFYHGSVAVNAHGTPPRVVELPVIEQFQIQSLRTYNRALTLESDRVYVDLNNQRAGQTPLSVEVRLEHNVTDQGLRDHFRIDDDVQLEVVLRAKRASVTH